MPEIEVPQPLDSEILRAFYNNAAIGISAKNFNFPSWQKVTLGDESVGTIPFTRLLSALGITPQAVYNQLVSDGIVKKRKWWQLSYYHNSLLNRQKRWIWETRRYEDIDPYPLTPVAFTSIARLLGKPIRTYKIDQYDGSIYQFTVTPNGESIDERAESLRV
ncbi:MAG: hypothetical protein IPK84_02940 [Candidatus Moraniibacteriota bacterium]|nr:MAG: hypothetical protein IPK84_02940 [Candidatus Moranbacteria bacterium]